MKLTKYLFAACAGLLLVACSNDDKWNTDGDVTVEMTNATMKVKEQVGFFTVPLTVTGKTNGPIRVTVDVAEYSQYPAEENVNYYVTSKTVTIPADSIQVGIEIYTVDDLEINEDRMFTVTITEAEGAKIGTQATTTITLRDNDGLFYEAIQGPWKLQFEDAFNGGTGSYDAVLSGFDEDETGYEDILYLSWDSPISGSDAFNIAVECHYEFDPTTNVIELVIEYGQIVASKDLSKYGLSVWDIMLCGVSGDYVLDQGYVIATVDPDLRTITFDPEDSFFLGVIDGGEFGGGWEWLTNMKMTR